MINSPHAKIDLIDRMQVTNSDGIHIRPAHALVSFAMTVSEQVGINIHVFKDGAKCGWRDVVLEEGKAINGFGLRYSTFLDLILSPGDTLQVKYLNQRKASCLPKISGLFRTLLNDSAVLESGGRDPRFETDYLAWR